MSNDAIKLLKIEAQRAQTFLFKVPRLADMDGANALLGDLFRQQLPLALEPYLAVPPDIEKIKRNLTDDPRAADDDPVANDTASSGKDVNLTSADVPYQAFRRGILVRDGGRFWGLVKAGKIEAAKDVAAATIQAHCPGLGYAFHVGDLESDDVPEDTPSESATDLVALPCFHWSEDGGDEPASREIKIGDDLRAVARSSVVKREARKASKGNDNGHALWDIASILRSRKYVPVATVQGTDKVDFTEIAANRYLAVIHMDGNGIGERSKNVADTIDEKDFLSRQARMEGFFFGMRSVMRAAVTFALNEHFKAAVDHYRLLMLGGDDVLIVCRSDRALPLVTSVARSLSSHTLTDNEPLTIGAGIVIGKPKLPFHRFHELAEQLAASAKRIALDPDGKRRSVVDWLITTSSWVDSVDDHRARWERICYRSAKSSNETLLLTGKPYPILAPSNSQQADEEVSEPSLEALLAFCEGLRAVCYEKGSGSEGARSQLKHYLAELRKGRTYAELAWAGLPEKVRRYFLEKSPAGFQAPGLRGSGLWVDLNHSVFRSWVADAIELAELQQIGRQGNDDIQARGAGDAGEEQTA